MMVTQIYGTLFCARCLETMGKVDPEELKALIDLEPDGPVCMACEPGPAEELPDIAGGWEEGHMLWFGDELFIALRSDDLKGDWLSFSHECARALAHSCLSSSTYLNKEPLTDLPMGDVTTTSMICPVCLLGMAQHGVDGWRCDICNWYRPDVKVCPICDLSICLLGKSGWLCDICGYFEPVPSRDSEG